MEKNSFKERVRLAMIENAKPYKDIFVDNEYLLYSEAFIGKSWYRIKADKSNYLHLTGVHTRLTAEEFFDKCWEGALKTEDFDFVKRHREEAAVKGAVRKKIKVLPDMTRLFEKELFAQADFKKNRVECAFAASDNICTLGCAACGRPKSLLAGNELDMKSAMKVDLILKKRRGSKDESYEIIYGKDFPSKSQKFSRIY
ncbi:MAG: PBECR4 domain-containing protein [Clostridium sp.]|nr:PBECR4 domain-containing protein [Clostridium sp.]